MKKIVVLGAGLSGLASAALLAQAGHQVTVLEQGDWIGGKSRRLTLAGQIVDTGPSLVTFPGVWQKFLDTYQQLGGKVAAAPDFIRLPEVGRYFFQGQEIDIPIPPGHPWYESWRRFADQHEPLSDAITKLLTTGPTDTASLPALGELLRVYRSGLTTSSYLTGLKWMPQGLRDLIAIHTLNAGVAPDQTLPIYASMTAIMAKDGITVPKGGVNELPRLMAMLAEAAGAEIRLNTKASKISKGMVEAGAESFNADVVVSSLDAAVTNQLLTGRPATAARNRSCSGVAIYAALSEPLPDGTVTHSVVMPDQPHRLYAALKENRAPEQTMTFVNYYLPGGIYDNLLPTVAVLLTAPADGAKNDLTTPWVRAEVDRVSKLIGLNKPIDSYFAEHQILNADYFGGYGHPLGALYGAKNPMWQSGPFHSPGYRSPLRPWLYRVGASVHPGGGIPAVIGGAMNSIAPLIREYPQQKTSARSG